MKHPAKSQTQIPACVPSLIDGVRFERGSSSHHLPVVNPSTEETICTVGEADAAEVGAAVLAARRAFDSGPWRKMDIDARKDTLYAIRDILLANADELSRLEAMQTGLPISGVRHHVARAAKNFEMFAEVASTLSGQTYSQSHNYLTYVTREPKGVAALIAPWNAPLALGSMRVATCIAFGNTCVLKPSEYTPVSMLRMVELMQEAGLPPGVVNLVNGRGSVTGAALVSHPGVDMVGFTGGSATGRSIMAAAGADLKPCILELGGKSASIVFESADLDQALDGTLLGIYANNGEQCLAGSRILVQRTIAKAFIEEFVARTAKIKMGDPLDDRTEMGPLAYRAHMERVLSFVGVAARDGARLLCGGKRAAAFGKGWYVEPTAIMVDSNDARVCQEEIFGPFATFLIFDDLDEAIRLTNASPFGLVCYVWSQDLRAVMRCSRDIRAGMVWVNTPMVRELRAPFGGYKESGVGRDGATSSADFFTQLKTTMIPVEKVLMPRIGLDNRSRAKTD